MSSGRGHIHRLPSRVSCVAKQAILAAFQTPELGIGAIASRTAIHKNVTVSIIKPTLIPRDEMPPIVVSVCTQLREQL
jgi:hypothetical protein